MKELQECLHDIANDALSAIEDSLDLPHNWFQQTFHHHEDHSQWHLKRYVCEDSTSSSNNNNNINDDEKKQQDETVILPQHTDPSLLSVVILDQPGTNPGAMGLQHFRKIPDQEKREWTELPLHGHAVAAIFIGSVLSYITGGKCPSVKHRVIQKELVQERMAATFFLRPKGTAVLQVPPARALAGVTLKKQQVTFDAWSSRVSKNYMKGKATNKQQKNGNNKKQPDNQQQQQQTRYYRDEFTEVSLFGYNDPEDDGNDSKNKRLTGREKYLGGEIGLNGKIYCIPGHASRVLVIDPSTDPPIIKHIGPEFKGEYKWLRAVRLPSGIILGLPCHADSILRIDPETDEISTIEWDDHPMAPKRGLPWKYHGAGLSPIDGCLYLIPQFAETVLKFDPTTEAVSFFGGPFPGEGKWYGGLVGPKDGAIYGICQNARGVLRIDPATQTATIHGNFGEGKHLWHGGTLGTDNAIYGIPANADTCLKIEPGNPPIIKTFGTVRTGQHRSDGKYKFLGGANGDDGNVYFFPSDADHVVQINTKTNEVKEVGPNLRDLVKIHQNKWQNGFTAKHGFLYGIPLKGEKILRVQIKPGGDVEVSTTAGPFKGLNLWEGGVQDVVTGDMYCMPLNCADVLRIRPLDPKTL
ncbi:expressed unknown protein [Seminavis robusta]|uniref:Isopenicillin N synthase-like Fe(2+) 2OG dioxygenase domain-containing protein n=1 Tax=Seminavis robusta TaxID=568900 RepID=A0A9N8D759_9STRA|nr:expressed unknown protein [Seminavis robusta]|eukprot:Sro22_g015310.1 n/a (638) ;mRNA; r:70809-73068